MANNYYSNMGIPCCNTHIKTNGETESQQVFAPHAYDLMVDTPAYKYASNSRVGSIFDEHKRSQERLGIPVLVGEWGGQSEGTDWLFHIEYLLDKFDGYHWGHTYWAYYDGLLSDPIMTCLRRTSPVAVCGSIKEYSLDRENDIFTLTYDQDKEYGLPTEIYVHKAAKSVECDGEYALEPIGENGAAMLKISAGAGTHKVVIKF
jgi:endoglycosylceramidase